MSLYIWGQNDFGQLSLGNTEDVFAPLSIKESEESIKLVGCGGHHLVLVSEQGAVFVAGRNDKRQLGVAASFDKQSIPLLLELPPMVVVGQVACGYQHTVLLTAVHGRVWTFGGNVRGECGLGHEEAVVAVPTLVNLDDSPIAHVTTKGGHTLALRADGVLFGWGTNDSGQLGLGHCTPVVSSPTEVALLRSHALDAVECGCFHSVCCVSTGQTFVFGDNSVGQLGLGEESAESILAPTPVPWLDGRRVESVSCGFAHTVLLLAEQDVVLAFGSNEHGQLGLGHSEDVARPHRVEAACHRGATAVVCGYNATYFWLGDGLYACGTNARGELGVGKELGDQWLPVKVGGTEAGGGLTASNFCVLLPPGGPQQQQQLLLHASPRLAASQGFSDDMARLLVARVMTDVALQAGADGGVFPAHRCILAARCARLGQLLDAADASRPAILPRMTSDTARRLLKYLYTGVALVDDASLTDILLLASASHTYQLLRLLCICEDEIKELLDDDNVILVLREACDLHLLAAKRICMEYIRAHYAGSVSARNRAIVEALSNAPELLAEVVGLSSPDYADKCISLLPPASPCPAPSLEFDMEALLESGAHADLVWVADSDEDVEHVGFAVHRVVLASRCPFFAAVFRAQLALKEDGEGASVSEEDRRRVQLVFDGAADDGQGRAVAREINKSHPDALQAFLLYLYTDRLDAVTGELAVDVLQMACVYGLAASRLAYECERILRASMSPENALDSLCVATQLGRQDLASFMREYIVENFVVCCADEAALRDAIGDFPELAGDLILAVAARLRQRGAEGSRVLKRLAGPAEARGAAT